MFAGYITIMTRQVMCQEFSRCYNDVNICLWTDGSNLTWPAAHLACRQRNSFLPRITNSNVQSKLAEFRSDDEKHSDLLKGFFYSFWIHVKVEDPTLYHWIDGSLLAGWYLFLQRVSIACYAERCISYSKSVRPSVCPSVTRWH